MMMMMSCYCRGCSAVREQGMGMMHICCQALLSGLAGPVVVVTGLLSIQLHCTAA